MNKQKYLAELSGLLSFLSSEDREMVINHFSKKFDEAGEAGESALIVALGTPVRLAIALNREGIESIIEAENRAARKQAAPSPAEPAQEPGLAPAESTAAAEAAPPVKDEAAPPEDGAVSPASPDGGEAAPPAGAASGPEKDAAISAGPEPPGPDAAEETDTPAEDALSAEELMREVLREEQAPVETASAAPEPAKAAPDGFGHNEAFPELSVARGIKTAPAPEPDEVRTSVGGAILFVILAVFPGIPLLAISVLLIPALLLPGVAAAAAGVIGFTVGGLTMSYIPDALFVFGASCLGLGVGLLLIMLAFWLLSRVALAWTSGVPALFRILVRRKAKK